MNGKLFKNQNDRWEIKNDETRYELTSGDVCEIKVGDHWIKTRIEHNGKYYYSTVPGTKLYSGQEARVEK